MNTSIKQKLLLVGFSIIITLVFLEGLLRLGGFIFNAKQDSRNQLGETQGVRILCIGESTTALGGVNSYPAQLERMLNKQKPDVGFKVFNRGMVSKTSKDLLAHLDRNIKKYQPDIIVSMIGINDYTIAGQEESFLKRVDVTLTNIRVYKLFKYIFEHAQAKQSNKGQEHQQNIEETMSVETKPYTELDVVMRQLAIIKQKEKQLSLLISKGDLEARKQMLILRVQKSFISYQAGRILMEKKDYLKAQKFYATSLKLDPNNFSSAYGLGVNYRHLGDYAKSIIYLTKVVELNPDNINATRELALSYSEAGQINQARLLFKQMLDKKPPLLWDWRTAADWFKEQGFLEDAEYAFTQLDHRNTIDPSIYENLVEIYDQMGNVAKRDEYQKKFKAKQKGVNKYFNFTINNYNEIINRALKRGIKVVAMQYPLRSVKPLKAILNQSNQVTFIENVDNFKLALQEGEFTDYFSDTFAGDFGHATAKGNKLIAENVAAIILNEVINK